VHAATELVAGSIEQAILFDEPVQTFSNGLAAFRP
jgi:hypothetical protein